MNEVKLKPCPFCGGEAEVEGITIFWIRCSECGVETDGFWEIDGAIEAWNRRVSDDRP